MIIWEDKELIVCRKPAGVISEAPPSGPGDRRPHGLRQDKARRGRALRRH